MAESFREQSSILTFSLPKMHCTDSTKFSSSLNVDYCFCCNYKVSYLLVRTYFKVGAQNAGKMAGEPSFSQEGLITGDHGPEP